MKSIIRLLVLFAISASLSAFAAVTASVDKDRIAPDETVHLLLQRDGSSNSQPDIGALKRDFDILGTSSGSSVQIINGHVSSRTQITLTLSPKHEGTIKVPPLQWDGEKSAPLELTVGRNSTNGVQAQPQMPTSHVFLTATLDHKQTYVQAAVVLTVRLYADEALYQASLDLPANADMLVRQLGKDVQTSEARNGRNFQVIERKYLLFPQRSGQLKLDGATLDARVVDTSTDDPFADGGLFGNAFGRLPLPGMMRSTRPLRVHADPVELEVSPRPATATGTNWLPAQSLTLKESWHPDNAVIHVGEPLTRRLHLVASGLTAAQLPDIGTTMPVPDGIKAYPDQAKLEDNPQGVTVLGSRDQDIALIASRPGHFTLPALKLTWWDIAHDTQRSVILPEHVVDIAPEAIGNVGSNPKSIAKPLPAPLDANSVPPSTLHANTTTGNTSAMSLWQWLSLSFGLLWLGTLTVWWYYSHQRKPSRGLQSGQHENQQGVIRADQAYDAFQTACRDNNPQAARAHLLDWAITVWPDRAALGLNALSRLLNDAKLVKPLRQLDRACYMGDKWNGKELAHLINRSSLGVETTEGLPRIPELYS